MHSLLSMDCNENGSATLSVCKAPPAEHIRVCSRNAMLSESGESWAFANMCSLCDRLEGCTGASEARTQVYKVL